MTRIIGWAIGGIWLAFAWSAYQRSRSGWEAGHGDVGFWWAVIAAFLAIAAVSAIVGTSLHAGSERG